MMNAGKAPVNAETKIAKNGTGNASAQQGTNITAQRLI